MSRSRPPWFIDNDDFWRLFRKGRASISVIRAHDTLRRAGWTYDIREDGWWAPGLQKAIYSPTARLKSPPDAEKRPQPKPGAQVSAPGWEGVLRQSVAVIAASNFDRFQDRTSQPSSSE